MPNKNLLSGIAQGAGIAGTAYGIAQDIFGIGDKRQLRQQKKLQEQQIEGQKEMLEAQREKEMQMWKDTNYAAQVDQMNEAGLSVGMIYGKGGGGGTTVGGSGQGIAGAQAATGAQRTQANAGMYGVGLQGTMMKAQIEALKSQANKNNAEATATAGVKTEQATAETVRIEATTKLIGEQTKNTEISRTGIEIDNRLKNLEADVAEATKTNRINVINAQLEKTWNEIEMLKSNIEKQNIDNTIKSRATEDIIKGYNASVENMIANTLKSYAETNLTEEKAKAISTQLAQGWAQQETSKRNTDEMVKAILISSGINAAGNVLRSVTDITKMLKTPKQRSGGKETFNDGQGTTYENWWDKYQ